DYASIHCGKKSESGHRVVTAGMPGMATQQTPGTEQNALEGVMPLERFEHVLTAARGKPAAGGETGRNPELIQTDQGDRGPGEGELQPAPQRRWNWEEPLWFPVPRSAFRV